MNYNEVMEAYRKFKYLRYNMHSFNNFESVVAAYLISNFQLFTGILAEVASFIYLTRQEHLIDIIINFVAFAGITNFGNLYTMANPKIKEAS